MTFEKGWLKRQFDHVANDVKTWPEWMKRERLAESRARRREHAQDPSSQDAPAPRSATSGQENKS